MSIINIRLQLDIVSVPIKFISTLVEHLQFTLQLWSYEIPVVGGG